MHVEVGGMINVRSRVANALHAHQFARQKRLRNVVVVGRQKGLHHNALLVRNVTGVLTTLLGLLVI